ncbi:MAG: hypothetical protein ACPH5V_08170, partial [Alcanivorax sp.]
SDLAVDIQRSKTLGATDDPATLGITVSDGTDKAIGAFVENVLPSSGINTYKVYDHWAYQKDGGLLGTTSTVKIGSSDMTLTETSKLDLSAVTHDLVIELHGNGHVTVTADGGTTDNTYVLEAWGIQDIELGKNENRIKVLDTNALKGNLIKNSSPGANYSNILDYSEFTADTEINVSAIDGDSLKYATGLSYDNVLTKESMAFSLAGITAGDAMIFGFNSETTAIDAVDFSDEPARNEFAGQLQERLNFLTSAEPALSVSATATNLVVTVQSLDVVTDQISGLTLTTSGVVTGTHQAASFSDATDEHDVLIDSVIGTNGAALISGGSATFKYALASWLATDGALSHSIVITDATGLVSGKGIGGGFRSGDLLNFSGTMTDLDISKSNGDVFVFGTTVANDIKLGSGDNTVKAGSGDDTLDGGRGSDTYIFEDNWGVDTITEYGPEASGTFNPLDASDPDQADEDTGSLGDHLDYTRVTDGMVHVVSE